MLGAHNNIFTSSQSWTVMSRINKNNLRFCIINIIFLQLYTDFYSSDIIVTSPLGLRMIVGAEGEEDRDYDFLASIEILVLDQTDVFLMQNWDHLLHVLEHFHLQPKKTHGTDFSRVRSWAVNGWAKYYRLV